MATAAEAFIERVVKLPLGAKAAIVAGTVAAITAGNFFLLVQPAQKQIASAQREMKKLEEQYIQNRAIADNLNQYRKEKELLEQQLAKALTELPEEANIEGLIQSFYEIAGSSGLRIESITPRGEKKSQFYASVPLAMNVTGTYHELAVFFDAVSKLKRIVNISGLKMGQPKQRNEKIELKASYTATAFRFLSPTDAAAQGKGKKGKKGKK